MTDLKDFDGLLHLGRVARTVKVGGFEIKMHTLNAGEYTKMMERVGDDQSSAKRLESIQREVISSSIDTINGQTLSADDKSKLVGMMQVGLSNMLYEEYSSMAEEQSKVIEDAKKNSAQTKTG
jgi:hypothetical protein